MTRTRSPRGRAAPHYCLICQRNTVHKPNGDWFRPWGKCIEHRPGLPRRSEVQRPEPRDLTPTGARER